MEIKETEKQKIVNKLNRYAQVFDEHMREPVGDADLEKMLNHAGAPVGRALVDLAVACVTLSVDGNEFSALSDVRELAQRMFYDDESFLVFEGIAKRRAIELAILMMRRADTRVINEGWVSEPLEDG
ncbi:MAG: hypothetical protein IT209_00570 [Armatimonadetes bacterium]|nr:hypothetical protein [Armatimonadota bacterium]